MDPTFSGSVDEPQNSYTHYILSVSPVEGISFLPSLFVSLHSKLAMYNFINTGVLGSTVRVMTWHSSDIDPASITNLPYHGILSICVFYYNVQLLPYGISFIFEFLSVSSWRVILLNQQNNLCADFQTDWNQLDSCQW